MPTYPYSQVQREFIKQIRDEVDHKEDFSIVMIGEMLYPAEESTPV